MHSLFISHGPPTLVSDDSPAHRFLQQLGRDVAPPRAIVCVSAHWDTPGAARVTSAGAPATIHDFYGFPPELYRTRYPAPGEPALAQRIVERLRAAGLAAEADAGRGLDHSAWVPLALMYPRADIPVLQVSMSARSGAGYHLCLGRALAFLREENVSLVASGGATHNLAGFRGQPADAPPEDYATAFDDWLASRVEEGDLESLLDYRARAPFAARNHPTEEHYFPLLTAAGAAPSPRGQTLHASFMHAMLSMRCFGWG